MSKQILVHRNLWLHLIGSRLYGQRRFEKEAKKIGVQRTVPFSVLRKVQFGDIVFLGEHKKIDDEDTVTVFGYFVLSGISHANLSQEVAEELISNLRVERKIDNGNRSESRMCGSYSVGSTYVVKDSIAEIVEKIEKACEKFAKDAEQFKHFLKGEYESLVKPIILRKQRHFLGYKHLEGKRFSEFIAKSVHKGSITQIFEYNRRTYLRKRDKDKVDNMLLTEFMEARR